jgi:diguanylate cyclase (GGDEF)-like protein
MAHSPAATAARLEALLAVRDHLSRSAPLVVVVIWSCALLLWQQSPRTGLLAWAVTQTVVAIAFVVYLGLASRTTASPQAVSNDTRTMAAWLLTLGAGFAIGFVTLALPAPTGVAYGFALLVALLSAGAVVALTGCRAGFLAFSLPAMLTVALALAWRGAATLDPRPLATGAVLLTVTLALVVGQRRLERALIGAMVRERAREARLTRLGSSLDRLRRRNEELSADREEFLAASLTDGLTGLANRRHFDRTLLRDWERGRREASPLACIMMDIDRFKHYNDIYGHMEGDDCLRVIAEIIAGSVSRGADFAARYGGEEFVVLLPGTDAAGARLLAERIREAVERRGIPHSGGGLGRVVTLSAGVGALVPSHRYPSAQSLVDLADEALYSAKKRGRNRVVVRDLEDRLSLSDGGSAGR